MELKKFNLNFNNLSIPFYYKKTPKDTGSYFAKIIRGDLYKKLNSNRKIDLIVDLGANFGAASIYKS